MVRPGPQRMLNTRQAGFTGNIAFAVTAQTQQGGKITWAGKLPGRLVRQMTGRTNPGLGHRHTLQIFFFGPGTQQVMAGIGNRLFVRVTVQA